MNFYDVLALVGETFPGIPETEFVFINATYVIEKAVVYNLVEVKRRTGIYGVKSPVTGKVYVFVGWTVSHGMIQ
jgi:hypothetical protein